MGAICFTKIIGVFAYLIAILILHHSLYIRKLEHNVLSCLQFVCIIIIIIVVVEVNVR